MQKSELNRIAERLHLTAYQVWVLDLNFEKYDLDKIRRNGHDVVVPYRCKLSKNWRESLARFLWGPPADHIGPDRMIAHGKRGAPH